MRAPVLFTPQQRVGSDDGLVRAIELVLTPLVFAGVGLLLDKAFGTTPVLTIVLAAVALVGKVAAEWYRYDHRMRRHEDELLGDRPSNTRRLTTPEPTEGGLPAGVTLDSRIDVDGSR
jgi:hypothetical protein